ncbi:hypothetical protein JCM10207_006134 [Rhodosporidiobolus poonsookiae]
MHDSSPRSALGDVSNTSSTSSEPNSSPSRHTPSTTPASSRLPYELLFNILRLAAVPTGASRPPHGGSVKFWHSFEEAAPFALVCKSWRGPAQSVLFSSVALIGERRARLFTRTLKDPSSASLAHKTAFLVLAVDPHVEASRDGKLGQLETSELLLTALEACTAVQHLQVRPLSQEVRPRLLAVLFDSRRTLRTIVLSPRILASLPWSGDLWHAEDASNPITTVENLEITTFVLPSDTRLGPIFPLMALKRVKVHYDYPKEILLGGLIQSPNLRYLDLYFEALQPLDEMEAALRASAASVQTLHYICNPTHSELETLVSRAAASASPPVPLLDRLLPLYTALTHLRVSATDISPSSLAALPPSLTRLHVKSLNVHSRFTCAALLAVLRRQAPRVVFPDAFRELVVVDAPEQWEADAREGDSQEGETPLDEVRRRLRERGVRFSFRWDFEEEDGTSGTASTARSVEMSSREGSREGRGHGEGEGQGEGDGQGEEECGSPRGRSESGSSQER